MKAQERFFSYLSPRLDKVIHPTLRYPLVFFAYYLIFRLLFYPLYATKYVILTQFMAFPIFGVLFLYYAYYILEMSADYSNKAISLKKYIQRVITIFLSLITLYSVLYTIIYDVSPYAFENVSGNNIFERFFEFFYFSFGVMLLNNMSEIYTLSFIAKIVVMLQMLTTFGYLTILIANYRTIGTEYKKYLKLKKGESTEQLAKRYKNDSNTDSSNIDSAR